jgi:hypothetical protein
MATPEIKIMACSNVYIRLMEFRHAGDTELGHSHIYDHATVLSSGAVKYEVLDGKYGNVVAEKNFTAPDIIFVEKNKYHKITALEDKTICSCTHALKTIDSDLIPPDSIITPINKKEFGENVYGDIEKAIKKPFERIIHGID